MMRIPLHSLKSYLYLFRICPITATHTHFCVYRNGNGSSTFLPELVTRTRKQIKVETYAKRNKLSNRRQRMNRENGPVDKRNQQQRKNRVTMTHTSSISNNDDDDNSDSDIDIRSTTSSNKNTKKNNLINNEQTSKQKINK